MYYSNNYSINYYLWWFKEFNKDINAYFITIELPEYLQRDFFYQRIYSSQTPPTRNMYRIGYPFHIRGTVAVVDLFDLNKKLVGSTLIPLNSPKKADKSPITMYPPMI